MTKENKKWEPAKARRAEQFYDLYIYPPLIRKLQLSAIEGGNLFSGDGRVEPFQDGFHVPLGQGKSSWYTFTSEISKKAYWCPA